jgi:hypothetical protein
MGIHCHDEFEESIDTKKHAIAVAVAKKIDIELKQVSSAVMTEYDKKGKCAELERFEREKANGDRWHNNQRTC